MNRILRTLATAAAGLAITAGSVVTAAPAHATGEGCYGFPSQPDAYVCVVTFAPGNAVPGASVGSTYVTTVPSFCYGSGCTGDQHVTIPIAGVGFGSEPVLVLMYKGQPYTVGTGGLGGGVPGLDAVYPWVDYAMVWVTFLRDTVNTLDYQTIVEQLVGDISLDCYELEQWLSATLGRSVNIKQC